MAIDNGAVAIISLIERDAVVALAQQLAELPLSILDRMPPQIVAVDLDQVESAEGCGVIVPAIPEQVED